MSHCSSSSSRKGDQSVSPAFATKTSSRPNSSTVRSTSRWFSATRERSTRTATARPPSASDPAGDVLRQPRCLVVGDDDGGALGRERIGHRRPDLAAGAGDHGDATVERAAHPHRLEATESTDGPGRPLVTRAQPGDARPPAPARALRRDRCSTRWEHLVGLQAQVPLDPVHGALVTARRLPARRASPSTSPRARRRADRRHARDDPPRHELRTASLASTHAAHSRRRAVAASGGRARHSQASTWTPVLASAADAPGRAAAHTGTELARHSASASRASTQPRLPSPAGASFALVQVPPRGVWGETSK